MKKFKEITNKQLETSLKTAAACFDTWRFKSFTERAVIVSKAAAIAQLRASGQTRMADMVSGMDLVPGRGIDFTALGHVLGLIMLLYAGASLFAWMQGYALNIIVQRTVSNLRREAQEKMNRLPLAYFDTHPHGELLSRVTNDIDNVATSLQQHKFLFFFSDEIDLFTYLCASLKIKE